MNVINPERYERLASLFDYPQEDYPARVESAIRFLAKSHPHAAAQLQAFAMDLPSEGERLTGDGLDEIQEIFTRSFDVQAVTTLSVGYIAFGDDYKRGELLVNLAREYREAEVDCGTELADHLPNVLRLMAKWQDQELVVEFVEEILHAAVRTMIAEFGPERMEERNKLYEKHFKTLIDSSASRGTMFRQLLVALLTVLEEDFNPSERQQPKQQSDFLRSVGRELDIEETEGRPAAQTGSML
jgi:nitrate reductase assembly molybdenum cofactor insertion protein NarJ